MLTSTSHLLKEETSTPISTITIILPASLLNTPCISNLSLSQVTNKPADIFLTERDPVFGSVPFSVQHGGCGERGSHVILPIDSLVQSENVTDDTILQFSSAAVSHLYGVFPTHGFGNDSRYPDTYQVGEVVLDNTGCSLKNKLLCSDDLYDKFAPTKQNLLCNNKSPRSLVTSHKQGCDKNTDKRKIMLPSFHYVSHIT